MTCPSKWTDDKVTTRCTAYISPWVKMTIWGCPCRAEIIAIPWLSLRRLRWMSAKTLFFSSAKCEYTTAVFTKFWSAAAKKSLSEQGLQTNMIWFFMKRLDQERSGHIRALPIHVEVCSYVYIYIYTYMDVFINSFRDTSNISTP